MSGRLREPFALVPAWVDERITDGFAMRLYVRLARKYADRKRDAFPREDTLAKEMQVSERTIGRALTHLVEVGALTVTRERKLTSGHYGRNFYNLPTEDPWRDLQAPNLADGPDQQEQDVSAGGAQWTNMAPGQAPNMATGSEQGERGKRAGQGQRPNMSDGHTPNMSDQEPDPLKQPEEGSKHAEADASAAQPEPPADEADPDGEHLFASEAAFEPPVDGTSEQGQSRNGSAPKSGSPRKPRAQVPIQGAAAADASGPSAQTVTAAWVDAYREAHPDLKPSSVLIGQASRNAKALLVAGNAAPRVIEAARRAGRGGWPNIERELMALTNPRNAQRNGHTPYTEPNRADAARIYAQGIS